MRIAPPKTLKLDKAALLRDVRERLAEYIPSYAKNANPTDPGWLLLEEVAWMVEMLSEQLDEYPMSVVQQFVHMLGGQLRPAHPAIGVVVVSPSSAGLMKLPEDRPSPWRFFTAQTEERDMIEFVPIEAEVDIRQATVDSVTRLVDGQLILSGRPEDDGTQDVAWSKELGPSDLFDGEYVEFHIVSANQTEMLERVQKAITVIEERNLGWLDFSTSKMGDGTVAVRAKINVDRAFSRTAPEGIAPGGDLIGDWNSLDGSTWTPPVRVSSDGSLPPRLRGAPIMPGKDDGTLLVPDVPAERSLEGLLRQPAAPIPSKVVDAIWKSLANADAKLKPIRPAIKRFIPPRDDDGAEPTWVASVLNSQDWDRIQGLHDRTVVHVVMAHRSRKAGHVRVGLVHRGGTEGMGNVRVLGIEKDGTVSVEPLEVDEAWALPLPADRGAGTQTVRALDIAVAREHHSFLVVVEGAILASMVNPILVANTPRVPDGREVHIERTVPEAVTLLDRDIVSPLVMDQLLSEPLPESIRDVLRRMPLASFQIKKGRPIRNFRGVQLDASTGEMLFNAPDEHGEVQTLRPGAIVELSWYRRTDGEHGEVEPGAIEYVEQPPSARPSLAAIHNPVGTFYGGPRESEQSCRDRLFTPSVSTPVLPADWERAIRQALGARGRDWMVRCWGHAERSLVSGSLWPLPPSSPDPESLRVARELRRAGPEKLLVIVGPQNAVLSDEDLDWARSVVNDVIRRVSDRIPTIRGALVTRFWPLTMVGGVDSEYGLPTFDARQMSGRIIDIDGREAEPPKSALLLNAAVVQASSDPGGKLV